MARVEITPEVVVGDGPLAIIAGPCQIETTEHALELGSALRDACARRGLPFIYKSSFDKANRTASGARRGPGLQTGLEVLATVREELCVPVLTDIHEPSQADPAGAVVDVLQIPAFLARQTDLLVAAARTGRVVNVKKAQFMAPWDMGNVVAKLVDAGTDRILVTERGSSFGYNSLVVDYRGLPQMAGLGYPIVFDATHSVQQPGGLGTASGGQREFVGPLSRAAVAVGVDAVFLEVHETPAKAPSDAASMLPLEDLEPLLDDLVALRAALT